MINKMAPMSEEKEREQEQCIQDARSFIRYGDYDLAISVLFDVLNSKASLKQKVTAHKLLCQCYRKTEEYSLALLHINRALTLNSKANLNEEVKEEHAICLMNKGIVFETQGKYKDAIACYQPAIRIFHELFEEHQESHGVIINALLTLGSCYEKSGNLKLALDTYRRCLLYFHENKENDRRYLALVGTINELNNVFNTDSSLR